MVALIFILFYAVLLPGLVAKFRSFFAGRRGRPLFQHINDLVLDVKKRPVYSETSSFITRVATPFDLACTIAVMLCIPIGTHNALISFPGDIIFVLYAFSLGKIMIMLLSLDSASSFGGMGASRESLYNILCEPAYMILVATLCMVTGTWSFSQLFSVFESETTNFLVLSILVGYGLFKLFLIECSKVPIDDPKTHLELTMVHEAQILELSAVDLVFVKISSWLKASIWAILCINTLVPYDIPFLLEVGYILVALIIFSLLVATVESFKARYPLSRNPLYVLSASVVGILAFMTACLIISF